jgi:hypothetical protein
MSASSEIDAGLDRLMSTAKYGEPSTLHKISTECGCTDEYIRQVEAQALRHLRALGHHGRTAQTIDGLMDGKLKHAKTRKIK